ncbi:hypothetical protein BM1_00671 [Bipolaris maydis]|nr:hypothetical protein BM1_00671 [Bipolaris maydis]
MQKLLRKDLTGNCSTHSYAVQHCKQISGTYGRTSLKAGFEYLRPYIVQRIHSKISSFFIANLAIPLTSGIHQQGFKR